jgi:hypothetical protein
MSAVELQITYSDNAFFEALLDPGSIGPHLAEAMKNIMAEYQAVAAEYAPESEANKPGRVDQDGNPMGYYERGRGWWYPLVTHNTLAGEGEIPVLRPHTKAPKTMKASTLAAVGIKSVTGYRLNPTSEQMADRWSTSVTQSGDEVVGQLTNTASYSDLVQGLEQVLLHQSRGWRTVVTSWQDNDLVLFVNDQTFKAINAFYHLGV